MRKGCATVDSTGVVVLNVMSVNTCMIGILVNSFVTCTLTHEKYSYRIQSKVKTYLICSRIGRIKISPCKDLEQSSPIQRAIVLEFKYHTVHENITQYNFESIASNWL